MTYLHKIHYMVDLSTLISLHADWCGEHEKSVILEVVVQSYINFGICVRNTLHHYF